MSALVSPDVEAFSLAALDICGASSCLGHDDPEFPALICTLQRGHDGMHHQEGRSCSWEISDEAWNRLARDGAAT